MKGRRIGEQYLPRIAYTFRLRRPKALSYLTLDCQISFFRCTAYLKKTER